MTTNRRLVFPALIAAGLLWGTTVPLSKLALGWLPPAWLGFTRFGLAAAILMVVSRSRLREALTPAIAISGALGYGLAVVLQNIGVQHTSVTHAALLIGTMPALVAIIAAACGHGVARPMAWAGFALSLAGVAVIAGGKGGGSTLGGDGLVLAAQVVGAAFVVSQARLLRGRDPIAVTAVQLLAAAIATLPVALLTEHVHASHATPSALLATGALVLAGTVAPTAMFAFGQTRVSADVAGAFVNLEPLVGAIAGTVLFGDALGPVQLAGGMAILAGIGLGSLQVVRAGRAARVAVPVQAPILVGTVPAGGALVGSVAASSPANSAPANSAPAGTRLAGAQPAWAAGTRSARPRRLARGVLAWRAERAQLTPAGTSRPATAARLRAAAAGQRTAGQRAAGQRAARQHSRGAAIHPLASRVTGRPPKRVRRAAARSRDTSRSLTADRACQPAAS